LTVGRTNGLHGLIIADKEVGYTPVLGNRIFEEKNKRFGLFYACYRHGLKFVRHGSLVDIFGD
jgi:hypothetical protein